MPKINFIERQSDDDLACFTIHDGRTILKFFLDEYDLGHLAGELAVANDHLRQRAAENKRVARAMKASRFPRKTKTRG